MVENRTPDDISRDLLAARRATELATAELQEAVRRRDELIAEASAFGMTRRAVAGMAGVTYGRVQQVVDAAKA